MKAILVSALCLHSALAIAQGTSESRLINTDYKAGSTHTEQALRTLSATNKLGAESQVDYKAGQAVVLLPGFEAKAGSVFVAHIGDVSIIASVEGQEAPLTVTVYPNPFEETTTISYSLLKSARVTLFVSDAKGAIVGRLVDGQQQDAGRHDVEWRGGLLSAGTYICTLDADQQRVSNRIVRK